MTQPPVLCLFSQTPTHHAPQYAETSNSPAPRIDASPSRSHASNIAASHPSSAINSPTQVLAAQAWPTCSPYASAPTSALPPDSPTLSLASRLALARHHYETPYYRDCPGSS